MKDGSGGNLNSSRKYLVFFRLFEHAEQRSFVPPIMMIDDAILHVRTKKRTWIKIIFKEIAGLSVVLPVRKSEKQSLFTYVLPHQRGNTAGPL